MSSSYTQNIVDKLFRSRQNILLLNVSHAFNCESYFDLSILSKLLPNVSSRSIPLGNHTIVTLICTSSINENIIKLGEFKIDGFDRFKHQFYLVKSRMLTPMNISLLKTSQEYVNGSEINLLLERYFRCTTIFLDYTIGQTNAFKSYLESIRVPFSIAIMDGFDKQPDMEKYTRPHNLKEIIDGYKRKYKLKCAVINRKFNFDNFTYLVANKSSDRIAMTNAQRDRIEHNVLFLFEPDLWQSIINGNGMQNLSQRAGNITKDSMINDCVLFSLKEALTVDYVFFEKLIPDWRSHLEKELHQYNYIIPKDKIEYICKKIICEDFAEYVVKKLKKYIIS